MCFSKVDLLKKQIDKKFDKFEETNKLYDWHRLKWTYNANTREKNALSHDEVATFLSDRITYFVRPFEDYNQTLNHANAFDCVYRIAKNTKKLNLGRVLEIYSHLSKTVVFRATDACFQNSEGCVVQNTHPKEIENELFDLLDWVNTNQDLHPVRRVAIFYIRFNKIRPFAKANENLSELLMNLVLMQSGYQPFVFRVENKYRHRKALEDQELFVKYIAYELECYYSLILLDKADKIVKKINYSKKLNKNERESLILEQLLFGSQSIGQILDIAVCLKRSTIKSDLRRLLKEGRVLKKGIGKGVVYSLPLSRSDSSLSNKGYSSNKQGFTLIELIIVIGIIAIIATAIFVALDPARRFGEARNARRSMDIENILKAVMLYKVDNGGTLPNGLDTTLKMIGTDGSGCDVQCGSTFGDSQTIDHNFNSSVDYSVSNGSLIEVDASNNNLVRLVDLGGGSYSISKPYVELATPETINNPTSINSITGTLGGGNAGSVEYSVKHNGTDKWWNGSTWITNSGELQSGDDTWDSDLELVWHLNESSGSINDSKNSHGGSYNGALYSQSGKMNTTLGFDGSNDIITGPSSNAITGDNLQTISISAWVKHSDTGDNGYIVSLKRSSSASTLISLDAGNTGAGNLGFLTRNYANTTHRWLNHNGGYNDGNWHHIVAVVDGLTRTLYIDGVQRNTDNEGMQSVTGNTSEFTVGAFHSSNPIAFDGDIDEVAVYKKALSASEVRKLYADQNNDKHTNTESELDTNLSSLSVADSDTLTLACYLVSNGSQAVELDDADLMWTQASGSSTPASACLDLSSEIDYYMKDIPKDPKYGDAANTYYAIQSNILGTIYVYACGAERSEIIRVTR